MAVSSRSGRAAPVGLALVGIALLIALLAWQLRALPGSGPGAVAAPQRDAAVRPQARAVGPVLAQAAAGPTAAPALGEASAAQGSGRTALVAAAPEAQRIRGQVLARRNGHPIPGAQVSAGSEASRVRGSSDADGAFELLWEGALGPDLEVEAAGFVPARLPRVAASRDGAPAEELVLRLEAEAVIEGLVVGPPAQGAGAPTVRLHARSGRGETGGELARTAVDAGGAFRFSGLPAGDYLVAAEAPERALAIATAVVAAGEQAQVLLELPRAGRLSGLVLDRSDRPVEGAEVRLESRRQGLGSGVQAASRREARTGPDGRFVLQGLSAGTNRIELRAPWGERRREELELVRSDEPIERTFRLRAPATLEGRVLAADGAPVPGAWVELAWGSSVPALLSDPAPALGARSATSLRTRADALGRFRLEDLPADRGAILVAVPAEPGDGRVALETGLELVAGEERTGVELMLASALSLGGSVHLVDGEPLVGARVELVPRLAGRRRAEPLRTETDLEGRFAFEALPAGEYRLSARHGDALGAAQTVELGAARADLRLELEGALRLQGSVLDEHELAVPFAGVGAERVEGPNLSSREGGERRYARADAYGRFEFRELEVGLYELQPHAGGYAPLDAPLVLRVPQEGDLSLRLRREAQPKPAQISGRVELLGTREAPVGFEARGVRGALLSYEDGRFRLDGVAPGVHELVLTASGCISIPTGPLELQPGARLDLGIVKLELGTPLRVEVRDAAGERVGGARVQLRPLPAAEGGREGAAALRLRENGRGRYEVLAPRAAWRLSVSAPGFAGHERRIEVGVRDAQRLWVALERN